FRYQFWYYKSPGFACLALLRKKSKLEQAYLLELTSCHFSLYFIQIDLCRRDIFFYGAPGRQSAMVDSNLVLPVASM
ncbi:MAG: hypothetical protein ABRQ39_24745, partial [Candidatus Eremiobacterota bacterium]